jgi:hypothetical protein
MNYWITTHWAPRAGEQDVPPSGVWLSEGRQKAGADLAADDRVLIYQAATGRTEIRLLANGQQQKRRRTRGREGVVAITRACGPITGDPQALPTQYTDGTTLLWSWRAPTVILSSKGFVPRKELNSILGFHADYQLRGFGAGHSGLKKITKTEFDSLVSAFKVGATKSSLIERALKRKFRPSVRPTGGESPAHLNLKHFIAADPSTVLGEAGLTTVNVESSFPTGDRADIVLMDALGRIIGLEVEVDVGDEDIPGVLQAIKYRAMLEFTTQQPAGQGRAFLVAYTISKPLRKIAEKYGVECFTVDRKRIPCSRQRSPAASR